MSRVANADNSLELNLENEWMNPFGSSKIIDDFLADSAFYNSRLSEFLKSADFSYLDDLQPPEGESVEAVDLVDEAPDACSRAEEFVEVPEFEVLQPVYQELSPMPSEDPAVQVPEFFPAPQQAVHQPFHQLPDYYQQQQPQAPAAASYMYMPYCPPPQYAPQQFSSELPFYSNPPPVLYPPTHYPQAAPSPPQFLPLQQPQQQPRYYNNQVQDYEHTVFIPTFESCMAGKMSAKRLPQRQPSEKAMLLDLNRCKYQRWKTAVEFVRKHLGRRHHMFHFICDLLDASEHSTEHIQWLTETQTMDSPRAFEFKDTQGLIQKYNQRFGENLSYKSFSNMLSLKKWTENGVVILKKLGKSQRNKYVLLPDLEDSDLGRLGSTVIDFSNSGRLVEELIM